MKSKLKWLLEMMLFYPDKGARRVWGLRGQKKCKDKRNGLDTSVRLGSPLERGVAELLEERES